MVVLTTPLTVCYANAEEKVNLCVEKKDEAVLNTLQTENKRNPHLGTAQFNYLKEVEVSCKFLVNHRPR